jgi:hypothetical protein
MANKKWITQYLSIYKNIKIKKVNDKAKAILNCSIVMLEFA